MVKGASISQLAAPALKLAGIGTLIFTMASLRFKKRTA